MSKEKLVDYSQPFLKSVELKKEANGISFSSSGETIVFTGELLKIISDNCVDRKLIIDNNTM